MRTRSALFIAAVLIFAGVAQAQQHFICHTGYKCPCGTKSATTTFPAPSPSTLYSARTPRHAVPCTVTGGTDCDFAPPGHPDAETLARNQAGTNTTELIDMSTTAPVWVAGPAMSRPRVEINAVLLPSGQVLAVGGSANDEDGSTASLTADLYDPKTNSFSSAAPNIYPHLYHSTALLLPDATVVLSGGNPKQGVFEPHIEIYQPAYLFNADGSLAMRPSLTAAPTTVGYGKTFTVQSNGTIASAVLIREGAATHAFDMSQRQVGLSFTTNGQTLTLTAPLNGNVAPPGVYLLFPVNTNGVPSVGQVVTIQ
jgi:hypothetical protein